MNIQLEPFFNLNSKNAIAVPATVFIYGLNDPTTGKCRYVGKSNDPHKRFGKHLLRAGEIRTYKDRWICGLAAQGLKPVLEVLDEVPKAEWKFWEQEYIRVFRMIGFRLTNLTDGGEGVTMTPETRGKISAANKRRKQSPETRAKISVANSGKKRSPETCARMSAAASVSNLGRKQSIETRAKMSAAHKAAWKIRKLR